MSFGFDSNDGYLLEEDSDVEQAESSEDEIEQWLHGTPEQKRKIRRRSIGLDSDSSDEFEKEMELELDETVRVLEQQRKDNAEAKPSTSGHANQQEFYDDVYFDSDLEEDDDEPKTVAGTKKRKLTGGKNKQHQVVSNDDLLYDPDMDDADQNWVDKHRNKYQPSVKSKGQGQSKVKKLPNSDAVLNCPACMTTLCLDCQRHETYKTQYRAMFTMNCNVDKTEVLKFPKQKNNRKKNKKSKKSESKDHPDLSRLVDRNIAEAACSMDMDVTVPHDNDVKHSGANTNQDNPVTSSVNKTNSLGTSTSASMSRDTQSSSDTANKMDVSNTSSNASTKVSPSSSVIDADVYHPVRCSQCNTEVGVFDQDEVFHFFNVLSSYT